MTSPTVSTTEKGTTMIPNHLIREILVAEGFKLHDVNGEQDLKPYVYNGFRKCLAEALKVTPLVFERRSRLTLISKCHCYVIQELRRETHGADGDFLFTAHDCDVTERYATEALAIEAANKLHANAVVSQLVYGG